MTKKRLVIILKKLVIRLSLRGVARNEANSRSNLVEKENILKGDLKVDEK